MPLAQPCRPSHHLPSFDGADDGFGEGIDGDVFFKEACQDRAEEEHAAALEVEFIEGEGDFQAAGEGDGAGLVDAADDLAGGDVLDALDLLADGGEFGAFVAGADGGAAGARDSSGPV